MGYKCTYCGLYYDLDYELPIWANDKKINDYLNKMMSDKDFSLAVLLQLLDSAKDSSWCCSLQKFFDSQVYNINLID